MHKTIEEKAQDLIEKHNQLDPRLLSVSSMNPYKAVTSSPREQMFAGNLAQFQIVEGATERFHQTGVEREFAKYVFNITSPANAEILKVINLYPNKMGSDNFKINPRSLIIYEDIETNMIGSIIIENFSSNHPYFGYNYRPTNSLNKIRQGAVLSKGEILMQSPIVTDDGTYKYGIETNVASMSLSGVAEDGIIASESFCKKLTYSTFIKTSCEFGPEYFPLNLYGDESNYRVCPDIGAKVREDGLLFARRKFKESTALYDQSPHGLMEFQDGYDDPIYVQPGGTVVDIKIYHNPNIRRDRTPFGMDTQLEKYYKANYEYHKAIVDEYFRIYKLRKASLRITPEFSRLVRESLFITGHNDGDKLRPQRRNKDLDDWRLEFVIHYKNIPSVGFKVTDCQGGSIQPSPLS